MDAIKSLSENPIVVRAAGPSEAKDGPAGRPTIALPPPNQDFRMCTKEVPHAADGSPGDPRLIRALEDYAAALEAGRPLDRAEFLARHAEIAASLKDCLEALELVREATPQLAHPAALRPAGRGGQPEFWPADMLGDYRIVREIGRGGMGVVYEVVQVSLGRRVALKVLPFGAALDAKQLQRFRNEAQAAAQLHHQNIVPVYGVGCERGVHYYAMQYIDGVTLAALIAELRSLSRADRIEPLPATRAAVSLAAELFQKETGLQPRENDPRQALSTVQAAARQTMSSLGGGSAKTAEFFRTAAKLASQAAAALEHAHSSGIVHRDIKPANLLVDARGNLWITDFGLAHCQSQAAMTMTGELLGTLRYMSPEQALGQRDLLDHRTDIYSLGATLYELLTLEPVFEGRDRQELLRHIANDEPRRPRGLNDAIPVELETIALKAMEKNPADRYATAQHLADDLRRYLDDEPIRARPPTMFDKVKKWLRRHRSAVRTALVMLGLLLVSVAVVATGAAVRLKQEKNATTEQLRLTQEAKSEAMRQLYRSRVEQARANRLTGRIGQRFKTVEILAEAIRYARDMKLPEEDFLELRNEVIASLALADLRIAEEWPGFPSGGMAFNFDGALRRYARIDRQGIVSVCRMGTGEVLHELTAFGPGNLGPAEETWMNFNDDGRWLSLWRGGRMKFWDLGGAQPKLAAEIADINIHSPDYS